MVDDLVVLDLIEGGGYSEVYDVESLAPPKVKSCFGICQEVQLPSHKCCIAASKGERVQVL